MTEETRVTQDFLDSSQYVESSILHYESIYGEDFVSPGGAGLAFELISEMALEPGSRVLDVGCGLGGSAFVMARDFGLRVDGIDLSRNMLKLAERKLQDNGLSDSVNLSWGDCLELDCREQYDAVYSRDVFLHIADKARLFRVLERALKPGGRLLFTDYCCSLPPWDEEFQAYVDERGYILHTPDEYAAFIRAAGFVSVVARDETGRFAEILQAELERMDGLSIEPAQLDKLRLSWRKKLERAGTGHQRWGLFSALRKP